MSETTEITFERGYRRLQEIADEVNDAEVPVDRMADLFAEGKGLDKALTEHLEEQKTRIENIERGDEFQAFKVVPSQPAEASPEEPSVDPSDGDSGIAGSADFSPAPVGAGQSDDDIPF